MKSILDPTFPYVDSAKTDIRKTFERVRHQQAEDRRARELADAARIATNVAPIRKGKK
jgi:hypothetical protein